MPTLWPPSCWGRARPSAFTPSTIAAGETAGLLKGGWLGVRHLFVSAMAQNFWMAIFAFVGCFVGTVVISLATRPNKTDDELRGLVYSLTEKPTDDHRAPWYARPMPLAAVVLGATIFLNVLFW